ncbi:Hypothetical protein BC94_0542 [Mycoplasmopsis bovis]|uniref:Uncharacterized protein n=1 Tax=Mycoplasmopsis bovis TaxID=28903 RepID=A0A8D4A296_MYCBV|nr:Hypothetical protein BC85_0539 [Mycoplasmopsis bovis]AMW25807.1 Hypothetical protein BC94_0542 [Mycoplasmopsis bovis]AMW26438.1 Hypothetical protein BC93_0539 [Mycoplasmopsis bovis]
MQRQKLTKTSELKTYQKHNLVQLEKLQKSMSQKAIYVEKFH